MGGDRTGEPFSVSTNDLVLGNLIMKTEPGPAASLARDTTV